MLPFLLGKMTQTIITNQINWFLPQYIMYHPHLVLHVTPLSLSLSLSLLLISHLCSSVCSSHRLPVVKAAWAPSLIASFPPARHLPLLVNIMVCSIFSSAPFIIQQISLTVPAPGFVGREAEPSSEVQFWVLLGSCWLSPLLLPPSRSLRLLLVDPELITPVWSTLQTLPLCL